MSVDSWLNKVFKIKPLDPSKEQAKREKIARRKQEIEKARYQVRFDQDLAAAREQIESIRDLPGAETQLAKALGHIDEAVKLGKSQMYKEACEKSLSKVRSAVDEGHKAADNQRRVAHEKFKTIFEKKAGLAKSVANDPLLTRKAKTDLLIALEHAVKPLLQSAATPETGKQVEIVLNKVDDNRATANHNAKIWQNGATVQQMIAERETQQLESFHATRDIALLKHDLQIIAGLMEEKEFEAAVSLAGSVKERAHAKAESLKQASKEWQSLKDKTPDLQKRCGELEKSPCPMVAKEPPTVTRTKTDLAELAKRKVGEEIPFDEACDVIKRCEEQVVANELRHAKYLELASARDEATLRVGKLVAMAESARDSLIQKINAKLSGQGKHASTTGPYDVRLTTLRSAWNLALERVLEPGDLIAAENEATVGLTKLTSELKETANNSQSVEKAGQKAVLAGALDQLDKTRDAARLAIDRLHVCGASDDIISPLEKDLLTALSRAEDAHSDDQLNPQIKALEELKAKAEEAENKIKMELPAKQQAAAKAAEKADAHLRGLRKRIKEFDQSFLTRSPQYKQYAEQFEKELESLRELANSSDAEILDGAIRDLKALTKLVTDTAIALESRNLPPNALTLESLTERIKNFGKRLDHEALTQYLPETKGALKQELDDIEAGRLKTTMDKTDLLLKAWFQKYRGAVDAATKTGKAYETFATQVDEAKNELKKSKAQFTEADCEAYHAALLKRLDKCLADGKEEGGLKAARDDLAVVKNEIADALKNKESMTRGESAAQESISKGEADQAAWKEMYDAFVKNFLPKVESKEPLPKLLEEVKKLGEMADESFKKMKDLSTARFQLANARERGEMVMEFPHGLELGAGTRLPDACKAWRSTVEKYRQEVKAVVEAVAKEEPTAREELEKAAARVANLFLAGAFDAAVDAITKSADSGVKRSNREAALAIVRRYKAVILKDGRIRMLKDNPFVSFTSVHALHTALMTLEKNLLVGL